MGCFSGIVRTLMFIFNIACLIIGLAILALGSFIYVSMKNYADSFLTLPILLIVVGVFISLVAFLGCCGTIKSNKCMLLTYAIVLLVLLVIQLAGGIYGLVLIKGKNQYNDFKSEIFNQLVNTLKEYNDNDASKTFIDGLQNVYQCCGINSKEDYLGIVILMPYPGSCCGKTQTETCADGDVYDKGCGDKIFQGIEYYINVISIVVICICAIELLCALLAIYLSRKK